MGSMSIKGYQTDKVIQVGITNAGNEVTELAVNFAF